jgi:hypothetical protein
MTNAQRIALAKIRSRWAIVLDVQQAIGIDCLMVHVRSENGLEMWLGIEIDGYTHS